MKFGGLLVLMFVATTVPLTGWAEQISGQLYPEKRTCLLGEPVFVVLDLVNAGSQAAWISEISTIRGSNGTKRWQRERERRRGWAFSCFKVGWQKSSAGKGSRG
jgi:hypothetical protein